MANKKLKGRGAIVVLGCFALMVSGMLALFDGYFVRAHLQEREARAHWEQVPGVVTASKIDASHGSDGSSYTPRIHFQYRFDGRDYTGKRYSFLDDFSGGEAYASRAVEAHPKGAEVITYVNPTDPSQAVLSVDGSAFPKLALLLLTPFHCIAIGLLASVIAGLRRRRAQGDLTDLEFQYVHFSDQHHFVIRKMPVPAIACFLGLLGLMTFVATFIVGFSGADHLAPYVLGASALTAGALTVHFAKKSRRAENFLHVDREGRTFAYPADGERIGFGDHNVIDVESTRTNVTINDEPIYEHQIRIGEDTDAATMFEFKGPIQDGEELRGIIERELVRSPERGAAQGPEKDTEKDTAKDPAKDTDQAA